MQTTCTYYIRIPLSKNVGSRPELTFRWANSLCDRLVSSHYSATFAPRSKSRSIHRCGQFKFCSWVCPGSEFTPPNGEPFFPRFTVDCSTQGAIYLMSCVCGVFYVGKTAQHFWQHIKDHVFYASNGKMLTPSVDI